MGQPGITEKHIQITFFRVRPFLSAGGCLKAKKFMYISITPWEVLWSMPGIYRKY